ncbi:MAG: hypothetical protein JXR35_02480 [Rhodobacteraceae bacterium]|nr:hypothetical protein [Paracoccaceae bacterium]
MNSLKRNSLSRGGVLLTTIAVALAPAGPAAVAHSGLKPAYNLGLGVYGSFQARWTIMRNSRVAARLRWLFYDLRPVLRAYSVGRDLEWRHVQGKDARRSALLGASPMIG